MKNEKEMKLWQTHVIKNLSDCQILVIKNAPKKFECIFMGPYLSMIVILVKVPLLLPLVVLVPCLLAAPVRLLSKLLSMLLSILLSRFLSKLLSILLSRLLSRLLSKLLSRLFFLRCISKCIPGPGTNIHRDDHSYHWCAAHHPRQVALLKRWKYVEKIDKDLIDCQVWLFLIVPVLCENLDHSTCLELSLSQEQCWETF